MARRRKQAPSESAALREVRRALRWLKRAERSLAKSEAAERRAAMGGSKAVARQVAELRAAGFEVEDRAEQG